MILWLLAVFTCQGDGRDRGSNNKMSSQSINGGYSAIKWLKCLQQFHHESALIMDRYWTKDGEQSDGLRKAEEYRDNKIRQETESAVVKKWEKSKEKSE